jgi:hypothetical protein
VSNRREFGIKRRPLRMDWARVRHDFSWHTLPAVYVKLHVLGCKPTRCTMSPLASIQRLSAATESWREWDEPHALQGDRDIKSREAERRKNTTLFVVNFDVVRTQERDLTDLYERYGRLRRVQV